MKKEILVLTDALGNCGIQRVLSELTNEWVNCGHCVSIAYIQNQASSEADFSWNNEIELIALSVSPGAFGTYYGLIRHYFKLLNNRPNAVVVSLSVLTNFAIGAVAPFVKNKIIISDRNDPTRRPAGAVKQFFRNLAFKQADTLVLQTDDVRKYYIRKIKRNGVVIPNPINPDLPPIVDGGSRRLVIVTASRLNKQKNLNMLLESFSKLINEFPDYSLEIYGRGSEEDALKEKARLLGISDNVFFKGFSKNIYDDIQDSAIYVCSSDYEGISNSLLEALGLGLPCISTDCPVGGSRLLIENDVNGILIKVGDTDSLYLQMKRLIEHPEFAETLSKNAVKVRERYKVERIAQMWIENM